MSTHPPRSRYYFCPIDLAGRLLAMGATATTVFVAQVMASYLNRKDPAASTMCPSVLTIAAAVGAGERTVRRDLAWLVSQGLLEHKGRSRYHTTTYAPTTKLMELLETEQAEPDMSWVPEDAASPETERPEKKPEPPRKIAKPKQPASSAAMGYAATTKPADEATEPTDDDPRWPHFLEARGVWTLRCGTEDYDWAKFCAGVAPTEGEAAVRAARRLRKSFPNWSPEARKNPPSFSTFFSDDRWKKHAGKAEPETPAEPEPSKRSPDAWRKAMNL